MVVKTITVWNSSGFKCYFWKSSSSMWAKQKVMVAIKQEREIKELWKEKVNIQLTVTNSIGDG